MTGTLPPDQASLLDAYADFLATAPLNLVARAARTQVRSHIDETRALHTLIALEPGTRWIDLGTGGGLPGLVLAVLSPATEWVLIDSVGKKVDAVSAFVRDAGIENIVLRQGRAEELAWETGLRGTAAGVTTRAVAALDVVAELTRGFLRPGGLSIAVKGPRVQDELPAFAGVRSRLGYGEHELVDVPAAPRPTWLVIMRAVGAPPRGVPRGTGLPQHRPLGGTPGRP